MITIGRMPAVVNRFFHPAPKDFSNLAWPHFWGLITAMALATEHTVERLNACYGCGPTRPGGSRKPKVVCTWCTK